MENLNKLLEQFQNEKDTHTEIISSRTPILKEYVSILDKVIAEIKNSIVLRKNFLEVIENDIEKKQKEMDDLFSKHNDNVKAFSKIVDDKKVEIAGIERLIASKISDRDILDKGIEVLTLEKTTLDNDILGMRASFSHNERINKSFVSENSRLEKSISEKKKEENELITMIEAKKKEHTSISEDILILDKRNK